MEIIIFRCQNGIVAWNKIPTGRNKFVWRCTRDQVGIDAPADSTKVEAFVLQMAQHSVQLAGAVLQVAQLSNLG